MHLKLSKVFEEQKDFDKAINHLIMVTKLEPDNYTSYLLAGDFYKRRGNLPAAESAYRKAYQKVQTQEGVLDVKKVLAGFYIDQKNIAQAKKIIDEIRVAYPKDIKGRMFEEQLERMKAKS